MKLTREKQRLYYQKFYEFIEKHKDQFSEQDYMIIIDLFENMEEVGVGIMMQIYTTIGMVDDNENPYKHLFNLLKNRHSLGVNALEIAGGCIPTFAKEIDDYQQKIGKGSVTVYDPRLFDEKVGNINLIKDKFNRHIDISSYDLIIGISPCKVTQLIIDAAAYYKKEFFIALCEDKYCFHSLPQPENKLPWMDYIYNYALNKIDNDFYLEKEFLNDLKIYSGRIISCYSKSKVLRPKNPNF